MAEAEGSFARFLRILFIKLLTTWWASLDDAAKDDVKFGVVAAVCGGVFILLVLHELSTRHSTALSTLQLSLSNRFKAIPLQLSNTGLLQTRLASHWMALKGEVRIAGLLCTAFLILAAFGSWPYNFYVLLRIIVCFSFVCFVVMLHRNHQFVAGALLAFWALLFNPIAPFHFSKDTWRCFNGAALITLVSALAVFARAQLAVEERLRVPPQERTLEALSAGRPVLDIKSKTYRYCDSCSVRVGRSDTFCKRCGKVLG